MGALLVGAFALLVTALIASFTHSRLAVAQSASFADGQASADGGWVLIGPGDADQVTSLQVLSPSGDVIVGTDIGGLYISSSGGESWSPINEGILNYDITTRVVQDPSDSKVLFVGTRGGLFKSTDGGGKWKNVRSGLPPKIGVSLSGSIGGLAIHPDKPGTILVGLGYRPSSDGTSTVKKQPWSREVYRSLNGGESWQAVTAFQTPSKVSQIVIDADGLAYAATTDGLYRSNDSGSSWEKLYSSNVYNVLTFNTNVNRLVIAAGDKGVLESLDGGGTWAELNDGLSFWPHPSGPNRYSVLAKSKDEGRIFVLNSTWGRSGGAYSRNGVANWELLTNTMPESWLKVSRRYNDLAIAGGGTIFLGSSRYLYRSDDWGANWIQLISKQVTGGWTHTGINVFGHTRDVVVDPNDPNTMLIATADHGLVVSRDRGESWSALQTDMKYGDTVVDLEFCAGEHPRIFAVSLKTAASADSCVSVSNSLSSHWRPLCSKLDSGVRMNKVISSPLDCELLLLSADNGVSKSTDGGQLWTRTLSASDSGKVYSISKAGSAGQEYFAAAQNGIYRSVDAGDIWRKILIPGIKSAFTSILVSNTDPDIILVGTEANQYGLGKLLRSGDGGLTWQVVLEGLRKQVSGIVEIPGAPGTFYMATNDHNYHDESAGSGIYRSRDRGKSWNAFMDGLPVHRAWNISVSPSHKGRVYLSSNGSGAYYHED